MLTINITLTSSIIHLSFAGNFVVVSEMCTEIVMPNLEGFKVSKQGRMMVRPLHVHPDREKMPDQWTLLLGPSSSLIRPISPSTSCLAQLKPYVSPLVKRNVRDVVAEVPK